MRHADHADRAPWRRCEHQRGEWAQSVLAHLGGHSNGITGRHLQRAKLLFFTRWIHMKPRYLETVWLREAHVYMYMYVYIYVCMHACMYVCMYVYCTYIQRTLTGYWQILTEHITTDHKGAPCKGKKSSRHFEILRELNLSFIKRWIGGAAKEIQQSPNNQS